MQCVETYIPSVGGSYCVDSGKMSDRIFRTQHFINSIYIKLLEGNGISSILLDKHDLIDKIISSELRVRRSMGAIGLQIIHKLSLLLPDLSEVTIGMKLASHPIHEQSKTSNANVTCIHCGLTKRPPMSFSGIPMRMEPWVCRTLWRLGDSELEWQQSALVGFNTDHHLFPAAAGSPGSSNANDVVDGLSQQQEVVDLHTKISQVVAISMADLPADAIMEAANKLAFQHGSTRDEWRSLDKITTSYNTVGSMDKHKGISLTRSQYEGIAHTPHQRFVPSDSHRAYIALGSNLGDRVGMIEKACREMDRVGIRVLRTSCLYETEPMYVLDQQSFLNGVCEVRSEQQPDDHPVRSCFMGSSAYDYTVGRYHSGTHSITGSA